MKRAIFNTTTCAVVVNSIILCFWAFYNNYPLLFFDTGTYISSGFSGYYPGDRPIFYGLFIRHISLASTAWLVVFAQGLLLSTFIYWAFKHLAKAKRAYIPMLCSTVFLVLTTGISVNVSQLIADVFTPMVVLGTLILLLTDRLNKIVKGGISVLTFFAIIVHTSHLLIVLSVLLCVSIFWLIVRYRQYTGWQVSGNRLLLVWVILAAAWVTVPATSYLYGNGFKMSRFTHIMMMYRLNEIGILDEYLEEACPHKDYKICQYMGDIPTNFIWHGERSPILRAGGFDSVKVEYDAIIADVLSKSKYQLRYAYKSIIYAPKQFFSFNTGDAPVMHKDVPAYTSVRYHFADEYRECMLARQGSGKLDWSELNDRQMIVVWASLLLILMLLFKADLRKLLSPDQIVLLGLVLLFLFVNAAVCTTFSTVAPRFQSRVIWLLPFAVILIATQWGLFDKGYKYLLTKLAPQPE